MLVILPLLSIFKTLLILKSHFSDPLKMLNIKFKVHKKCNKKDIVQKICEAYLIHKLKNSDIDNKINEKNINNVSQFIVNIKRLGYDMWFTIPLIFDTIYEEYELSSIKEAHIINNDKIYFQKTNNVLGFMCYILVKDWFINNVNIDLYDNIWLKNKIGYVAQETILFSDTIANNISYGLDNKSKRL